MLKEAIEFLNINPGGTYVDATLGGGGHAESILGKLGSGRLIGVDRDQEAIDASVDRLAMYANFTAKKSSFHDLPDLLDTLGVKKIDGVLYDLGISSFQIDMARRGFSYQQDGPLDMRMDVSANLTAGHIVNTYDEKQIARILFEHGEEKQAKKFARAICLERKLGKIESTIQLADLIKKNSKKKRGGTAHPAMRSFMALRIAVNNELEPLSDSIKNIVPYLNEDGRIVVITFHSLEDRIVKNTLRLLQNPCICPRDIPYCVCGKKPKLRLLSKKPTTPARAELDANSRSFSAKLRGAARL